MKDGIEKSNIEYVREQKNLGILIDSNPKFRAHIVKVVFKVNEMLRIIKGSFDNEGNMLL